MRYPVKLDKSEEGGYVVSFLDIPEALTQGDTREEALEMAQNALLTAFEFYFEDNEKIPEPSVITGDYIELPVSVVAKILMLNLFVDSKLTRSELARKMGVKKQEITRLFNLQHSTKIDTINQAIIAMGSKLSISLS
ncbi:TPA: type II toxin-antitoxin system HicB family antitoxin [Proteus mirabilis]|nr:type II toxin-antitoxin system HicB family antitoxin [Proteus mirabilis]HAU5535648.1 type II toxin-antitoxin system HicB family antitoxin [Proteus mirabilis]HAU5539286.1 type II toxin-antitoxin system HicB family antitoxin [Proteus mirabilis]HAU5542722.1 type II toxin-antitoxin system HicB family antitoxin [Proteus mirabilis]HAU5573659.1 type II toxin-antitoxin system HicB family antitoxin [Proteus mirabilis]